MPNIPKVKLDSGRLRDRISKAVMTQAEIAAKAGLSVATVYRGISGREIGSVSARSIAGALKTPLDDLLANNGEPTTAVAG